MSGLIPGDPIGSWQVMHPVHLGVGAAYQCVHTQVDHQALIKVLARDEYGRSESMFQHEVDALRLLHHEAIPKLVDYGTDLDRNLLWIATAPMDGVSLADHLIEGPIDWRDACAIFHRVASALRHMHAEGFTHRNVNPSNIFIEEGYSAWLVGMEFSIDESAEGLHTEAPLGELAYAAPEAIGGESTNGQRADLYALGVVFHEALTGGAAFPPAAWGERAEARTRMLELKTRSKPLDPGSICPDWLANLIRKATHPEASERLPDMDAFIGWLDAAEGHWVRQTVPVGRGRTTPAVPPPRLPLSLAPSITEAISIEEIRARSGQESSGRSTGPPIAMLYASAALMGMVAALGFSSVVLVFVEMRVTPL